MAAGIVYHNITTASGVTFAIACWVPNTASPDVGAIPVQLPIYSDGTAIADATGMKISTSSMGTLQTVDFVKSVGIVPVGFSTDQAALTIKGAAASGASASGNPVPGAGLAVSSETVVTAGQAAAFITDLARKLIVMPYANPENFVSGAITSAMTGTTSTSLIAAPAAGLRNYITQVTVSNAHATVGTDIALQDGSGGTTFYTIPAAAVYGGAVLSFPTPLKQPTTATALFCVNVTTGASTKVSASGYKGA